MKIYNFVLADRTMAFENGQFNFRNYTDTQGCFGNPGAVISFDDGTVFKGKRVGKMFTLNQSHYNLQARDDQKDFTGIKLLDYLKYAPFCEGSPNGTYMYADGGYVEFSDKERKDYDAIVSKIKSGEIVQEGVKYKILNAAKDAEILLETNTRRAKAEISAAELDEATLKDVAALYGIYGEPDALMRSQVQDRAKKKPVDYFKMLESGDRPVRAIIRKCIDNKTFSKKGELIMWEETIIGANEDDAVSKLLSDKDMLEALQENANLQTAIKIPGKRGPKPKKPVEA